MYMYTCTLAATTVLLHAGVCVCVCVCVCVIQVPAIMGMLGVWYNNFFGAQSHAMLPYDQVRGLLYTVHAYHWGR